MASTANTGTSISRVRVILLARVMSDSITGGVFHQWETSI
jgi:hypothetical protein